MQHLPHAPLERGTTKVEREPEWLARGFNEVYHLCKRGCRLRVGVEAGGRRKALSQIGSHGPGVVAEEDGA